MRSSLQIERLEDWLSEYGEPLDVGRRVDYDISSMSDAPLGPDWWLVSDGRWYPPELYPPESSAATSGPTVYGEAGAGPAAIAERAIRGRDGEIRTGQVLLGLPPDFTVIHAQPHGRGDADIDHLVIGPTGVWVIDTKAWTGALTHSKGMLFNGRTPIRSHVNSCEEQAAYTRTILGVDANPVLACVGTTLPRDARWSDGFACSPSTRSSTTSHRARPCCTPARSSSSPSGHWRGARTLQRSRVSLPRLPWAGSHHLHRFTPLHPNRRGAAKGASARWSLWLRSDC